MQCEKSQEKTTIKREVPNFPKVSKIAIFREIAKWVPCETFANISKMTQAKSIGNASLMTN